MSIILVEQTDSDPIDAGSWTKLVETDKYYNLTINKVSQNNFTGDTLKQGVQIAIGGSNYLVDSDEAITGTTSDYVKVTPSGSTATAEYVTDLTGVTWNSTYNFYEDVSGNAYLFDEMKALADGQISELKTIVYDLTKNIITEKVETTDLVSDNFSLNSVNIKSLNIPGNTKTESEIFTLIVNTFNLSTDESISTIGYFEDSSLSTITRGIFLFEDSVRFYRNNGDSIGTLSSLSSTNVPQDIKIVSISR